MKELLDNLGDTESLDHLEMSEQTHRFMVDKKPVVFARRQTLCFGLPVVHEEIPTGCIDVIRKDGRRQRCRLSVTP